MTDGSISVLIRLPNHEMKEEAFSYASDNWG